MRREGRSCALGAHVIEVNSLCKWAWQNEAKIVNLFRRRIPLTSCKACAVTRSNAPPYFHQASVVRGERKRTVRSLFRPRVVAASLGPLACVHAEPADDSWRLYAVDIWQDPPQSSGPGRGVYLGKA